MNGKKLDISEAEGRTMLLEAYTLGAMRQLSGLETYYRFTEPDAMQAINCRDARFLMGLIFKILHRRSRDGEEFKQAIGSDRAEKENRGW